MEEIEAVEYKIKRIEHRKQGLPEPDEPAPKVHIARGWG